MKKKYLKLTEDQIKRGVIFSSQLAGSIVIHEVFKTDDSIEAHKKIERLLDDSFFNRSPFKYNEIRQ